MLPGFDKGCMKCSSEARCSNQMTKLSMVFQDDHLFAMLIFPLSHRDRASQSMLIAHQIHAHPLQCRHSPVWISGLVIIIQLPKEAPYECWISVFENSFSNLSHEVELVVHVVHREKMCARRLFCCDVIDVGTCDAETALFCGSAAHALAAFFDGAEVFGVGGVSEIFDSVGGDGVSEALEYISIKFFSM